jgi:hypothetical protein
MSDEAVKVQYEGVCEEISEKNGWTSFAINVGRQYPVRLSTKLPALIEQGRAAGQERAVWSAKESQGGENPNKPGTFYTNRYLDGVEVGGAISPAAANASGGASRTTGNDETRGSIERQTIVKAAMPLYPAGLITTNAEFFALLLELEAFCSGVVPVPEVAVDDGIPFE